MNLLRDIRAYLKVYRRFIGRRLYIVFALTGAAAITEGFGITLLLPLIDSSDAGGGAAGRGGAATRVLYELLEVIGIGTSLVGILLFIGVVFLGKGALKFAEGAYGSYLRATLLREVKATMFNTYREMSYAHYAANNTGHFVNVINGQIYNFVRTFETFNRFLSTIIVTCSYLAIAFLLAWRFALMAVAAGLLLILLFRVLNRYVQELSRKTSEELSTLNKFLVQTLQSFKYLVSTHQMDHLKGGVMKSIRKLEGYYFRQGVASAFTQAIREPVSVLFLLLVIILQVTVFEAPIAPIFVALLLFHRAMQYMIGIQEDWQRTMDRIGSLEMVVRELDVVGETREKDGTVSIGPLQKGIEFENVCFRYPESREEALKEISLTIPANKTTAVVGESGSGKSTMIDLVTLLLKPRSGTIRIDGIASDRIQAASWRSQIGYVSQETVVFDETIANNICLWEGEYREDEELKERIHRAAEAASAQAFIEELSDGFETVVGDRGVRLSGGQRQRLFIARELFKNPNLLILDEATSALDSESELSIQKSIDALHGSVTVLTIAHRLSTIRDADNILVLDHGQLVEQGSYEALTQTEGSHFRRMVQLQTL
ncbi:MAG: ABC transporter ATP-binding protein [Balneolaceae bacterium]